MLLHVFKNTLTPAADLLFCSMKIAAGSLSEGEKKSTWRLIGNYLLNH
jgi:hypothetical protein